MDDPCQVRPAATTDIPAVAAIEQAVFSDPWPRSAFLELLGEGFLVASVRNEVAGYLVSRWVVDEAEILNIAVRPDSRRRGIGRRLLDTALQKFQASGATTVYLEVRESNAAGQAFYQIEGFQQVGRRPAYYQKPREDALILARPIGGSEGSA